MALLDFVRTTRMSWHQKGKTNLDLLEQEIDANGGHFCTYLKHTLHE